MKIENLLIFMDSMRYERKLTQEEYLDSIISQRQYYRYLYGESIPSFEVVVALSNRLGLQFDRLLTAYNYKKEKTKKDATLFFNLVIKKDFIQAIDMYEKLENMKGVDATTKLIIDIGYSILQFYTGNFTKEKLIDNLKNIIDFEDLIKKTTIQDLETYVLGVIMEYSDTYRELILNKLISLSSEEKIINFVNSNYSNQVYFFIIKNLGRLSRYRELIKESSKAIEKIKKKYSYYLLSDIYYYKALAHYRLGEMCLFQEELSQCVKILQIENKKKYLRFKKEIFKDTMFDIENLSDKNNMS